MAESEPAGRPRSRRWRSLQLLSQEEGIWRPNLLELLNGELSELRSLWAINPERGLIAARNSIAASIHALVAQLVPRKDRQPLTLGQRVEQYKTVVLVCFNALPSTPGLELRGKDLTQRRKWLSQPERGTLKASVRTSQRDFEHAITQIEQMLSDGGNRAVVVTGSIQSEPTTLVGYVPRPALHQAFAELVHEGAKLIAFVGQSGMGKTWLARVLTSRDGVEASRIRVIAGNIFEPDLEALFPNRGQAHPLNQSAVVRLAAALSESRHPFVVLDNVEDTGELSNLLPAHCQVPVIATCRTSNRVPVGCRVIPVGKMSPTESANLIRSRLPEGPTEAEVERLQVTFGHHPLLLEYVCVLLQHGSGSISDFCDGLRGNISSIGTEAQTESGDTLVAVLARLSTLLSQQNSRAYDLLVAIAFLAIHPIYSPYFSREIAASNGDEVMPDHEHAECIRLLAAYHLIDFTNKPFHAPFITMHPLTRDILTSRLFRDDAAAMIYKILKTQNRFVRDRVVRERGLPRGTGESHLQEMARYYLSAEELTASTLLLGELLIDRKFNDGAVVIPVAKRDLLENYLARRLLSLRMFDSTGWLSRGIASSQRWQSWLDGYIDRRGESDLGDV